MYLQKIYKIMFVIISVEIKHQVPAFLFAGPSFLNLVLGSKLSSFLMVMVLVLVQITDNDFMSTLLTLSFSSLSHRAKKLVTPENSCEKSYVVLF